MAKTTRRVSDPAKRGNGAECTCGDMDCEGNPCIYDDPFEGDYEDEGVSEEVPE